MAADDQLPAKADKGTPGQMDLSLAREFLDVTRKEMDLKAQELSLRKESEAQNHQFSLSSLAAYANDRNEQRGHRLASSRQSLYFAAFIVSLLVAFAALALFWNKEAIVLETLKLLAIFFGGLGTGAFWGYRKGQSEGDKNPSDTKTDPTGK